MGEKLGKITSVYFGHNRDYPFLLGIFLSLEWNGGGCGVCVDHSVNLSEAANWPDDQARHIAITNMVSYVSALLEDAKVNRIDQLVGKPVAIKDKGIGHCFTTQDFRILTEVL